MLLGGHRHWRAQNAPRELKLRFVRARPAFALLLVISLLASPLAAQSGVDAPNFAPAIGPWLGAARGQIAEVEPGTNSLTVSGTARDPDSAQRISYELLLDGDVVASGRTAQPDDFGANVGFSERLDAEPGLHELCLRLDDPSLGRRTVQCQDVITLPPERVDRGVAADATGVAVSSTGVVVPITGGTAGNLQVTTPCGAAARLTDAEIVERARIVIDPGHGGSESGAVGGGLFEKNVNLVVSNVVVEKFEQLGIPVQLTRTADYRVPLQSRADIATALAPDIFLSLHHNGGALRPSAEPGTEIFYAQGRDDSQRLAAILYEEMHAAASQFDANWVSTVNQGASVRLRDDGMDLFGIHRFSPGIDSVITEFLYLSNPSEAALMRDPAVIEAQAQSIVDGILRWWFDDADDPTTPGREFVDPGSTGTGGFDACVDPPLNGTDPFLTATAADELTANALGTDQPAPPRTLLPALVLGADPAIG